MKHVPFEGYSGQIEARDRGCDTHPPPITEWDRIKQIKKLIENSIRNRTAYGTMPPGTPISAPQWLCHLCVVIIFPETALISHVSHSLWYFGTLAKNALGAFLFLSAHYTAGASGMALCAVNTEGHPSSRAEILAAHSRGVLILPYTPTG